MAFPDLLHAIKSAASEGSRVYKESCRSRLAVTPAPLNAARVEKYLADRDVAYETQEGGGFVAELESGRKVQITLTGEDAGCVLVRVYWDSTIDVRFGKELAVALNDSNAGLVFPKVYAATVETDDGESALTVITEYAADFTGVGASDGQLEFILDNAVNQADGYFERFRVEINEIDEPSTGQYI